jgi:hypothetical protein
VDIFALHNIDSVLNARFDVLIGEVKIIIADNRFSRDTVTDQLQDGLNGNSSACNARFSEMDFGTDLDLFHEANIYHEGVAEQAEQKIDMRKMVDSGVG